MTGASWPVAAVIAGVLVPCIAGALYLNQRLQQQHPEFRGFRWGYFHALFGLFLGLPLSVLMALSMLGGQVTVWPLLLLADATIKVYALRRRRWAFLAMTALTFNLLVWLVNGYYAWRRWGEFASIPSGSPAPPATDGAAQAGP